ncbi:purine-nucleoside phosphorylase [Aciduricibacillus chroicocephali]|uniref:Purine nucleoside phosphorylase n=1 Tax=Aciduricibacillus chroicocephali TaxID=3054939 RepID=A0ABY9KRH5_9BACI|nr:purine-nucleoside phosphorylase [Bacillaceae bacterium 44XB]
MDQKILEAAEFIRTRITDKPEMGLVLGSGLGRYAEKIKNPQIVRYEEIPHFPVSTVEGHAGQFVSGELNGKRVLAMQGRFHFYEGYEMEQVVFPIRVMKALGATSLLLTNAAGGINESLKPGDLMLITDHYNNLGTNPLVGPNDPELGERFPDMSAVYDRDYIQCARNASQELGIDLKEGVYASNIGPVYETPAEVRALRVLGADAVGMSTVPEAIAARHMSMRIIGLSCITNMAAGILDEPLSHEEVIVTAAAAEQRFTSLVDKIIATMDVN